MSPAQEVTRRAVSAIARLPNHNRMVSEVLRAVILPGEGNKLRLPFAADQKTAVVDWEVDQTYQAGGTANVGVINTLYNVSAIQTLVMTGQPGVPWLRRQRLAGNLVGMSSGLVNSEATEVCAGWVPGSRFNLPLLIDYFSGRVDSGEGLEPVSFPSVRGAPFTNSYTPPIAARSICAYVPGGCYPTLMVRTSGAVLIAPCTFDATVSVVSYRPDGVTDGLQQGVVSVSMAIVDHYKWAGWPLGMGILDPGYYQFFIEVLTTSTGAVATNIELGMLLNRNANFITTIEPWTEDSLVPYSPPLINTERDAYTACRATSCAVLASNSSSVYAMEGSVLCARLDEEHALPKAASANVMKIAKAVAKSKRYFGLLRNGAYGFCPLETAYLKFRDYSVVGGTVNDITFPSPGIIVVTPIVDVRHVPVLYTGDAVPFSVFYFTDLSNANGASMLNLKLELHIEFRTDSALKEQAVAVGEQSDVLAAQQLIAHIPLFYENPTHWENIMHALNVAWRDIRPYAPALVLGASRIAARAVPGAAPLIRAAGYMAANRFR